MSKIDIYRLELVFLNPGENRWQMFQEAPPSKDDKVLARTLTNKTNSTRKKGIEEAVYRAQAEGLLRWVRQALSKHCEKHHKDEITCSSVLNASPSICTLNLSNLRGQLDRVSSWLAPPLNGESILKAIEKRTRIILESEGLSSQLCGPIFSVLRDKSDGNVQIKRQHVLALVSALFVARRWDVYGRLSFPPKELLPKSSPARHNVFSYWLTYPGPSDPVSEGDPVAERALNYKVKIKFSGLRDFSAKREFYSGESDFYECCYDPKRPEEAVWYCFYGILVDALHRALLGHSSEFQPGGRVNVTCLPLRICGYDHFLQLYLSRENDDDELSVAKMFVIEKKDEKPVSVPYNGTNVPIIALFKECLRELLVQMHISAFQHHVWFNLRRRRARPIALAEVDKIFCRHAPNLVRVEELLLPDKNLCFGYSEKHNSIFEEWGIIQESTLIRRKDEHIAEIRRHDGGIIQAYVPWEEDFDGPLNPLFSGTGQQRLQEQYEWLLRRVEVWNSNLGR